jgi:hypothetical protein
MYRIAGEIIIHTLLVNCQPHGVSGELCLRTRGCHRQDSMPVTCPVRLLELISSVYQLMFFFTIKQQQPTY